MWKKNSKETSVQIRNKIIVNLYLTLPLGQGFSYSYRKLQLLQSIRKEDVHMSTKKDYFTSGELAKMSGVSYKTIRYYVEKGLLRPEKTTESGYKLFGESSVRDLEKIIMLKYLDFDLNEIKRMLHEGNEKLSFEKQYIQSDNLESRINIHAYSTSKESWYEWLFQKFELAEGMKVLDVGCGNAAVRENLMPYKNLSEKYLADKLYL